MQREANRGEIPRVEDGLATAVASAGARAKLAPARVAAVDPAPPPGPIAPATRKET